MPKQIIFLIIPVTIQLFQSPAFALKWPVPPILLPQPYVPPAVPLVESVSNSKEQEITDQGATRDSAAAKRSVFKFRYLYSVALNELYTAKSNQYYSSAACIIIQSSRWGKRLFDSLYNSPNTRNLASTQMLALFLANSLRNKNDLASVRNGLIETLETEIEKAERSNLIPTAPQQLSFLDFELTAHEFESALSICNDYTFIDKIDLILPPQQDFEPDIIKKSLERIQKYTEAFDN